MRFAGQTLVELAQMFGLRDEGSLGSMGTSRRGLTMSLSPKSRGSEVLAVLCCKPKADDYNTPKHLINTIIYRC